MSLLSKDSKNYFEISCRRYYEDRNQLFICMTYRNTQYSNIKANDEKKYLRTVHLEDQLFHVVEICFVGRWEILQNASQSQFWLNTILCKCMG